MRIETLTDTIGVSVSNMTRADLLDPTLSDDLLDMLEKNGVLVFPNLHLDDPEQIAFSRQFGELEILPIPDAEYPEIFVVSLDPDKALSAEYLKGTFHWHIDGATVDTPNKATILSAHEVSAVGGETEFANTYAAWEALDNADKSRFGSLRVEHSFATAQRRVHPEPTDEQVRFWNERPSKVQPLAWKHASGRTSLVLGATASHVVDMPLEESDALIEDLQEWVTSSRFTYLHEWQVGDLVVWDNRGTMHRALPYAAESGRLMHRTTIAGEEPFQ